VTWLNLHERCRELREQGVPVHVRMFDTAAKRVGIWIYYGYAPAVARCSTAAEAEIAVEVAARVHWALTQEERKIA
jgi:hypothetical protein